MSSAAARRLPEPVDPAAPPKILARTAAVVILGGLLMLVLGAIAAANSADSSTADPLVPAEVLLAGWLLSLPLGIVLLSCYAAAGRRRLRRFERRAGFLPRAGRKQLPLSGRTTLFRVGYASRGARVCLMVTRWTHTTSTGWRSGEIVEHVWESADDPVTIGEQRERLTALAETLEERADDARLDREGDRMLVEEALVARRSQSQRSRQLAEDFARDSR